MWTLVHACDGFNQTGVRNPDLCRCWNMKSVIFTFLCLWLDGIFNHSVHVSVMPNRKKQGLQGQEPNSTKEIKKYIVKWWFVFCLWCSNQSCITTPDLFIQLLVKFLSLGKLAAPAKRAWEGKPKAEAVITPSACTVNLSMCRHLFMHGKELNCNGA